MRNLTYFIACSIDGFIGDPAGDARAFMPFVSGEFLDFLKSEYPETLPTHGRRQLGIDNLANRRFDTVVQGRASYDVARAVGITSPYAHLREYVVSRTIDKSPDPHVEIVADDVIGRIRKLKEEENALGIYLCGGAQVAGALIEEVDEIVVKTYPVVLGSGMPMFDSGFDITEFTLDAVRVFGNGVLVRSYCRKR